MSELLNALLSHISCFDDRDLKKMISRKQDLDSLIVEYCYQNNDSFSSQDLLDVSDKDRLEIASLLVKKLSHFYSKQNA